MKKSGPKTNNTKQSTVSTTTTATPSQSEVDGEEGGTMTANKVVVVNKKVSTRSVLGSRYAMSARADFLASTSPLLQVGVSTGSVLLDRIGRVSAAPSSWGDESEGDDDAEIVTTTTTDRNGGDNKTTSSSTAPCHHHLPSREELKEYYRAKILSIRGDDAIAGLDGLFEDHPQVRALYFPRPTTVSFTSDNGNGGPTRDDIEEYFGKKNEGDEGSSPTHHQQQKTAASNTTTTKRLVSLADALTDAFYEACMIDLHYRQQHHPASSSSPSHPSDIAHISNFVRNNLYPVILQHKQQSLVLEASMYHYQMGRKEKEVSLWKQRRVADNKDKKKIETANRRRIALLTTTVQNEDDALLFSNNATAKKSTTSTEKVHVPTLPPITLELLLERHYVRAAQLRHERAIIQNMKDKMPRYLCPPASSSPSKINHGFLPDATTLYSIYAICANRPQSWGVLQQQQPSSTTITANDDGDSDGVVVVNPVLPPIAPLAPVAATLHYTLPPPSPLSSSDHHTTTPGLLASALTKTVEGGNIALPLSQRYPPPGTLTSQDYSNPVPPLLLITYPSTTTSTTTTTLSAITTSLVSSGCSSTSFLLSDYCDEGIPEPSRPHDSDRTFDQLDKEYRFSRKVQRVVSLFQDKLYKDVVKLSILRSALISSSSTGNNSTSTPPPHPSLDTFITALSAGSQDTVQKHLTEHPATSIDVVSWASEAYRSLTTTLTTTTPTSISKRQPRVMLGGAVDTNDEEEPCGDNHDDPFIDEGKKHPTTSSTATAEVDDAAATSPSSLYVVDYLPSDLVERQASKVTNRISDSDPLLSSFYSDTGSAFTTEKMRIVRWLLTWQRKHHWVTPPAEVPPAAKQKKAPAAKLSTAKAVSSKKPVAPPAAAKKAVTSMFSNAPKKQAVVEELSSSSSDDDGIVVSSSSAAAATASTGPSSSTPSAPPKPAPKKKGRPPGKKSVAAAAGTAASGVATMEVERNNSVSEAQQPQPTSVAPSTPPPSVSTITATTIAQEQDNDSNNTTATTSASILLSKVLRTPGKSSSSVFNPWGHDQQYSSDPRSDECDTRKGVLRSVIQQLTRHQHAIESSRVRNQKGIITHTTTTVNSTKHCENTNDSTGSSSSDESSIHWDAGGEGYQCAREIGEDNFATGDVADVADTTDDDDKYDPSEEENEEDEGELICEGIDEILARMEAQGRRRSVRMAEMEQTRQIEEYHVKQYLESQKGYFESEEKGKEEQHAKDTSNIALVLGQLGCGKTSAVAAALHHLNIFGTGRSASPALQHRSREYLHYIATTTGAIPLPPPIPPVRTRDGGNPCTLVLNAAEIDAGSMRRSTKVIERLFTDLTQSHRVMSAVVPEGWSSTHHNAGAGGGVVCGVRGRAIRNPLLIGGAQHNWLNIEPVDSEAAASALSLLVSLPTEGNINPPQTTTPDDVLGSMRVAAILASNRILSSPASNTPTTTTNSDSDTNSMLDTWASKTSLAKAWKTHVVEEGSLKSFLAVVKERLDGLAGDGDGSLGGGRKNLSHQMLLDAGEQHRRAKADMEQAAIVAAAQQAKIDAAEKAEAAKTSGKGKLTNFFKPKPVIQIDEEEPSSPVKSNKGGSKKKPAAKKAPKKKGGIRSKRPRDEDIECISSDEDVEDDSEEEYDSDDLLLFNPSSPKESNKKTSKKSADNDDDHGDDSSSSISSELLLAPQQTTSSTHHEEEDDDTPLVPPSTTSKKATITTTAPPPPTKASPGKRLPKKASPAATAAKQPSIMSFFAPSKPAAAVASSSSSSAKPDDGSVVVSGGGSDMGIIPSQSSSSPPLSPLSSTQQPQQQQQPIDADTSPSPPKKGPRTLDSFFTKVVVMKPPAASSAVVAEKEEEDPDVVAGKHPDVVAGKHPDVVAGKHPDVVAGKHLFKEEIADESKPTPSVEVVTTTTSLTDQNSATTSLLTTTSSSAPIMINSSSSSSLKIIKAEEGDAETKVVALKKEEEATTTTTTTTTAVVSHYMTLGDLISADDIKNNTQSSISSPDWVLSPQQSSLTADNRLVPVKYSISALGEYDIKMDALLNVFSPPSVQWGEFTRRNHNAKNGTTAIASTSSSSSSPLSTRSACQQHITVVQVESGDVTFGDEPGFHGTLKRMSKESKFPVVLTGNVSLRPTILHRPGPCTDSSYQVDDHPYLHSMTLPVVPELHPAFVSSLLAPVAPHLSDSIPHPNHYDDAASPTSATTSGSAAAASASPATPLSVSAQPQIKGQRSLFSFAAVSSPTTVTNTSPTNVSAKKVSFPTTTTTTSPPLASCTLPPPPPLPSATLTPSAAIAKMNVDLLALDPCSHGLNGDVCHHTWASLPSSSPSTTLITSVASTTHTIHSAQHWLECLLRQALQYEGRSAALKTLEEVVHKGDAIALRACGNGAVQGVPGLKASATLLENIHDVLMGKWVPTLPSITIVIPCAYQTFVGHHAGYLKPKQLSHQLTAPAVCMPGTHPVTALTQLLSIAASEMGVMWFVPTTTTTPIGNDATSSSRSHRSTTKSSVPPQQQHDHHYHNKISTLVADPSGFRKMALQCMVSLASTGESTIDMRQRLTQLEWELVGARPVTARRQASLIEQAKSRDEASVTLLHRSREFMNSKFQRESSSSVEDSDRTTATMAAWRVLVHTSLETPSCATTTMPPSSTIATANDYSLSNYTIRERIASHQVALHSNINRFIAYCELVEEINTAVYTKAHLGIIGGIPLIESSSTSSIHNPTTTNTKEGATVAVSSATTTTTITKKPAAKKGGGAGITAAAKRRRGDEEALEEAKTALETLAVQLSDGLSHINQYFLDALPQHLLHQRDAESTRWQGVLYFEKMRSLHSIYRSMISDLHFKMEEQDGVTTSTTVDADHSTATTKKKVIAAPMLPPPLQPTTIINSNISSPDYRAAMVGSNINSNAPVSSMSSSVEDEYITLSSSAAAFRRNFVTSLETTTSFLTSELIGPSNDPFRAGHPQQHLSAIWGGISSSSSSSSSQQHQSHPVDYHQGTTVFSALRPMERKHLRKGLQVSVATGSSEALLDISSYLGSRRTAIT